MTGTPASMASVDRLQGIARLLRPRSVAIIGASDKPGALGASVLANLERNGYSGEIYLVNPKRDVIAGRKCCATIADLPDGIDAAVLAIPRAGVLEAVQALAARRCGAVIIFSAGFAEGGEAGLAEQAEIGRIARAAGMIVEGPNCLGMVNYVNAIPLTFVETNAQPIGDLPGVGIVSQSGAMACVLGVTVASRGLALSYSVSTGNEAASGVEDYLDYLIEDSDTRVITMIVEQFRQPKRFLAAARKASEAGKTIVLLHPGKSSAARASAATHTGAMAGDYQVMRVQVERAGVVFAETLEELADIAEIALRCPAMAANGVAVLGESGAFKALTLDFAEEIGLNLPAINDADSPALRAALPDFVPVSNPLDLTAQGLVEPDLYTRTLEALFGDERFGAVVAGIIQTDPVTSGIKLPPILAAAQSSNFNKPLIFAGLDEGAEMPAHFIASLRQLGIPYFPSTERAFRALKRLAGKVGKSQAVTDRAAIPLTSLRGLSGVVPEYASKGLLAPIGLPFPKGRMATTAAEGCSVASDIGFPVVLKAQSADLSHKSDAGGVILNVADEAQLHAAWDRLHADVRAYDASISLDGVLIEAMGQRGVELIVGARNDPEWGPVLLVGLGGVMAELFHDVRLLAPDLTQNDIVQELSRLKGAALLSGFRNSPALDVAALSGLIMTVAAFMRGNPDVAELDLNPVVLYPKGQGLVILDALMHIADNEDR